jgi:hypothetical protein
MGASPTKSHQNAAVLPQTMVSCSAHKEALMTFSPLFDGSVSDFRHKIIYNTVKRDFPGATRPFILSPEMRRLGFCLTGGRGSGKSRFLGRYFAFGDFTFEIPVVIFDTGDTIDNVLDRLKSKWLFYDLIRNNPAATEERIAWAREEYETFVNRVRYVNMAGIKGTIVPFPFYYRFGSESIAEIAQRFVEVIRRITPELQAASIQGFPPLERIANHAGRILFTLGFQATEMANLLTNIDAWQPRIQAALLKDPSLTESAEFFRPKNPAGFHISRAEPLLTELDRLTSTPAMKALFGASRPGINWQEVIDKKQIVLLDFRDVRRNPELYRLLMTATFRYLMDFLQYRGVNRTQPISVIVDEFSSLVAAPTPGAERLVINDMRLWFNEIMRRHNLWLTLAHQELSAVSPRVQSLLLGMGNQLIGKIADIDDCLHIAKSFIPIDPTKVKRYDPILGQQTQMGIFRTYYNTVELGEREIDYTIPEQHYEHAYQFQNLQPLHFLQRVPGTEMAGLADFSIAEFEKNIYPDPAHIENIRIALMMIAALQGDAGVTEKYVYNIDTVLAEIAARTSSDSPSPSQSPRPAPKLPVRRKGTV